MTKEKYRAVSEMTHISICVLYDLVKQARARGFNPEYDLRVEEKYVAPIRPPGPKHTVTSKVMEDKAIALIEKNRNGREKLAEVIGY